MNLNTIDLIEINCLTIKLGTDLFVSHYKDVQCLCRGLGSKFQEEGLLFPSLFNFRACSFMKSPEMSEEKYPNCRPIALEDTPALNSYDFGFAIAQDELYDEALDDCLGDHKQIQRRMVLPLEQTIRTKIEKLLSKRDMAYILALTQDLDEETIQKILSSRDAVKKLTDIYRDLFKTNSKIKKPASFFRLFAESYDKALNTNEIFKKLDSEIY